MAMAGLWRWRGEKRAAMSADFEHALKQEVLRTELIRVKALIGTAALLTVMLWTVYVLDPNMLDHLWRGHLKPSYLYGILVPFLLFELWVHSVISQHIRLNQDLPVFRRYLGVLIETSMPTAALALHMDNMGPVQALGFVVPLAYFIFIILSTLRLDFGCRPSRASSPQPNCSAWRCSIVRISIPIHRRRFSITARAA